MDRSCLASIAYDVGRGFAIAFMVLLAVAAGLLASGREAAASRVAEYAYYSLVAAVASMLTGTILEPGKEGEGGGCRGLWGRLGSSGGRFSVLALAVLAGLLPLYASAAGGYTLVPGRPTYTPSVPHGALEALAVSVAVSAAAATAASLRAGEPVAVAGGVMAFVSALAAPLGGWASVVALASAALLSAATVWAAVVAAGASALLALVGLLARSMRVEALGWGGLTSLTLLAVVAGFSASVTLLYTGLRHGEREARAPGEGGGGRLPGLLLLAVSVALSWAVLLVPRLVRGEGVYLLDTLYNLEKCAKLRSGVYSVFYSWGRPLYVAVATLPGALMGCPYKLYDIAIPMAGFAALQATVYLLVTRLGGDHVRAGLAAVLAAGFWAPFFAYAGLQTNLLTLPLAMAALYLTWHRGASWPALLLWLLVGLMHPWSLAFYTASLALALLAERVPPHRAARLLASTVPGWLAYAATVAAARRDFVGSVAKSEIVSWHNYIHSLRFWFWGTTVRADVLLLAAALLLALTLGRRQRGMMEGWIVGALLTAFLAAPLPEARLLPRLVIDSLAPLAVATTASRRELAVVAAAAALVAAMYAAHTAPVTPPP